MKDLYEFPFCDIKGKASHASIKNWVFNSLRLKVDHLQTFPRVQQSFTKYRADLYPFSFQCQQRDEVEHYEWVSLEEITQLTFSSGHRKILKEYISKL